ncbi:uracil phosphoribosyltransferase [Jonquetella anthropi]|uniref:uracil phosphoribosyltransferase n=1 Tax=Jonquetella anthropi TaxID=428712 RepID=UPI0023561C1D|nr:uracil phosphoribosyltransferase [Jonquetella anthropi]
MIVAIGSDHAGFALKQELIAELSKHHEIKDFGTDTAEVPCDYPDPALHVARSVARHEAERGILVCGTGIGMAIAANKVPGAYAADCWSDETAKMSRQHNNANILCLGARVLEAGKAVSMAKAWLETPFEGGRHERRTEKIRAFERSASFASVQGQGQVVVFDHPLIQHKLSVIRDVDTPVKTFRELVSELASLMVYEVTRDLPVEMVEVQTPISRTKAYALAGKKLAIVPILRAGLGMTEGVLNLIPNAKVGHIGLYRDPETLKPVEYYCKLPRDIGERDVLILDPMLATGGSSAAAVDLIKRHGGKKISLVCIIAAPEGIEVVHSAHPDVNIYCAALDTCLNEHGYIVPGLGDAGDRIFGTK